MGVNIKVKELLNTFLHNKILYHHTATLTITVYNNDNVSTQKQMEIKE